MKKLVIVPVFSLVASLFSGNAMAQSVVKINIFSPIVRTASVFFEQAVSQDKSLQLGVFYTGYSSQGTRFSGYGITPEFRFYLSSTNAPQGAYIAPYLRYQSFTLTDKETDGKGTYASMGGGLLVGKQWILKDKISVDAFIGPAYNSGKVKVTAGEDHDFDLGGLGGFTVRPGFTFGYKF
jgi:hypothetical protein